MPTVGMAKNAASSLSTGAPCLLVLLSYLRSTVCAGEFQIYNCRRGCRGGGSGVGWLDHWIVSSSFLLFLSKGPPKLQVQEGVSAQLEGGTLDESLGSLVLSPVWPPCTINSSSLSCLPEELQQLL